MKKAFLLFCAVLLSGQTLLGVTFRYVSTTSEESTFVTESDFPLTIEVNSENPEFLRIFDVNYLLDTPIYSFMTGPDCWEEHYFAAKFRTTITLCKSLSDGLTEIRTSNKKQVVRFRPAENERLEVIYMPPVFISQVEFANMKADGRVINDYGSDIGYRDVNHLSARVEYQSVATDKEITLDIQIVDKDGKLIRDKNHPEGYTASIPVATAVGNAGIVKQVVGLWKPKSAEKDWRIEFYADGRKLCSAEIPLRGITMYTPALIMRLSDGYQSSTGGLGRYYTQPRRGPVASFHKKNETYLVLKWNKVEI